MVIKMAKMVTSDVVALLDGLDVLGDWILFKEKTDLVQWDIWGGW